MGTVAGAETDGKWPEAGSPPAEWFEAMGRTEQRLNAYARAHGMPEVSSPDAEWREQLEGAVTLHAYMRAVDPPGVETWRTAARDLVAMARSALKIGVVPLLIPSGVTPMHFALLRGLLPGRGIGVVDVAGWSRLERADLVRLEQCATTFAVQVRARSGPKANVALRKLRALVCEALEKRCGPGSAKCYADAVAEAGGLLYEVVA